MDTNECPEEKIVRACILYGKCNEYSNLQGEGGSRFD